MSVKSNSVSCWRERVFSVPDLRKRGWTDAAIRRFMPTPDDTRPNPYYSRAAAPMKFYFSNRVKRLERTKGWQEWRIGRPNARPRR
jgi:hypothetical protein